MKEKENWHGFPFDYGDKLTPEMASENRKSARFFIIKTGKKFSVSLVFIYMLRSASLRFEKPNQSYSSFSNEPDRAIVRLVENDRLVDRMDSINGINRGGDFSKSGPGPQARSDAAKNVGKNGVRTGGSIFAQGFTAHPYYGSRPMRPINKPLSCRNAKINKEQFDGNKNPGKQTNQDLTLTREQRRNLPHPDDVIIPDQDVRIRHGQAKYKVKNHGSDFGLPSKPNKKGWLKTPRTSENIESFKDEIKKLVLRGERIEGTYRKSEPDQFSPIHFYDSASGCNAIFKQETKEFVSAWKLTQGQVNDLLTNKNIGDY